MKTLKYLEKNKTFWWLLALSIVFFLFRLPSLIEPYWYGDEGIYQVIGQALHNGYFLYQDIWDNKPPLLYALYALVNGDQMTIRLLSLIFGIASLVIFFFLSRRLLSSFTATIISTVFYLVLFATPLIEGNIANAENFFLLPIIASGLLVYTSLRGETTKQSSTFASKSAATQTLLTTYNDERFKLFSAGFLLGIAFLFKIVALFDFAAFLLFLYISSLSSPLRASPSARGVKRPSNLSKLLTNQIAATITWLRDDLLLFITGFILPLFITILYFTSHGALTDSIQAIFFGNVEYVGWQNSVLGIPQGLLLGKLFLLMCALFTIFFKRNALSQPILFILLWGVFSLFNAFFSGRDYTHYLLVMLPSFCLLIGLFVQTRTKSYRFMLLSSIVAMTLSLGHYFHLDLEKTITYYHNATAFVLGQRSVRDYQLFFDSKVPRDYELASFIKTHAKQSDTFYLWGNNPQIYALTYKLPPYKYTVAYHIKQNNVPIEQIQEALDKTKPRYIVILEESEPLPFSVPTYIIRFKLEGATIYERSI